MVEDGESEKRVPTEPIRSRKEPDATVSRIRVKRWKEDVRENGGTGHWTVSFRGGY